MSPEISDVVLVCALALRLFVGLWLIWQYVRWVRGRRRLNEDLLHAWLFQGATAVADFIR